MRFSRYFLPVLKESPKEAEIVSHKLMLRAGMLKQQAAGSYSWLPLGFKVLQKVVKIVEEEQQGLRALYVALTRSTRHLTVVHAEALPAPMQQSDTPAPSL